MFHFFHISKEIVLLLLGCRSAPISLEARSLTGWSTSRHCVVTSILSLNQDSFQDIRDKAGALIIVLPEKMESLSEEQKQVFFFMNEDF